jgi:hypothetical protein
MATVPNWGSLDYHQRQSMIQSGQADMQGNSTTQQTPYSGSVQGPGYTGSGGAGSSYVKDPSGNVTETITPNLIPQESQAEQDRMRLAAQLDSQALMQKNQLAAEAESRRLASIRSLSSGTSTIQPGGGMGPDETAARDAAFGRAKDNAGANALASLKALEAVMAGRGMRGSSAEASGVADVIMGGSGMVADQIRSQMVNDANRSAAIADRDYAGAVDMRGQDMARQNSLFGLLSATGGLY